MSVSITIHNIDDETARQLKEEAKLKGVSLDVLLLQFIREGITLTRTKAQPHIYHDLDALSGTWSDEEGNHFLNTLEQLEKVDKELWK